MSRFELLSLLTSLLAVIIAIVSMIRSSRTAKKQLQLQEVQAAFTAFQHKVLAAEQETRRHADLRAEHVGDGGRGKFVFSNVGAGIARNVNFGLTNAGPGHSPFVASQYNQIFPIKELRPNQSVSLIAAITLNTPSVLNGVFMWEDESGTARKCESKITL